MARRSVHPKLNLTVPGAERMLFGLMLVDVDELSALGTFRPKLLELIKRGRDGGVKYSRIDPDDHWQTVGEMLEQLHEHPYIEADCEDLAAWLAADMRVSGLDPFAKPVIRRTGPHLLHVQTWSPKYRQIIDPAALAGMSYDESSGGWGT